MGHVDDGDWRVAFDVTRCPVADYFAREGLSGLCAASFCDLDFRLASEWNAELCRPLTISR
ncbi:MAG: L-2-amino-thiazoline-4-carboxylic acid hydrolase [Coriobacteriia bacterium]|nr:L-2-amino-thiazoline-4-carboxylic acid hydrolase [Coriobacteriia bacterium]